MHIDNVVSKRYDFVYLFDVKDGNPNGDPDFSNTPRFDPETFQGLVSDVCLKRKIRDYVFALKSENGKFEKGYDIFVLQGHSLESRQQLPYDNLKLIPVNAAADEDDSDEEKPKAKKSSFKKDDFKTISSARNWICENFFDVRAFGAVMNTTDYKCGQVRGPVQITFSRSYDRILSSQHSIVRVNQTKEKDQIEKGGAGTFGNKHTVAYGLYCAYGFINPHFAAQTGFTYGDLNILWRTMINMFGSFDASASRGLMAARHLFVFEHDSALGEAPAHKLFDLIQVKKRSVDGKEIEIPRSYEDYIVPDINEISSKLPSGVKVTDKGNSEW